MASGRGRGGWGQAFTGLLLIGVGAVLLLDQQGVLDMSEIWGYWPVLLVILGLWKLTAPPPGRDVADGAGWIVIGGWILACIHHWLGLSFRNSWPLVFAAMGVQMILRALFPAPKKTKVEAEDETAPEEAQAGEEVPHA